MIAYTIPSLLLIFLIIKFYKNRALFKNLSKKEWLQYIVGYLSACAVAAIIIFGRTHLTNSIQTGWLTTILDIIIILIGLAFAGFIFEKLLPEKLKEFYK